MGPGQELRRGAAPDLSFSSSSLSTHGPSECLSAPVPPPLGIGWGGGGTASSISTSSAAPRASPPFPEWASTPEDGIPPCSGASWSAAAGCCCCGGGGVERRNLAAMASVSPPAALASAIILWAHEEPLGGEKKEEAEEEEGGRTLPEDRSVCGASADVGHNGSNVVDVSASAAPSISESPPACS